MAVAELREPLLWLVLGFVFLSRMLELAVTERNERRLLERGGVPAADDGLPALVAVHAAMFFLLPAEWALAAWPRLGAHTAVFLGLAAAAVALRYWALASLGPYYTKRVIRVPGAPLVARGPYRWLRHPIYRAVFVEMLAWPLAFGCWFTAAAVGAAHLVALRRRIRAEEAHLGLG